jgi:hypothetical protein
MICRGLDSIIPISCKRRAEKRIEPRVRTRATDVGHQRAEEHIDPALKSRMNYATSVKPLA